MNDWNTFDNFERENFPVRYLCRKGITELLEGTIRTIGPILLGAGLGELADKTPYFKDAIPYGLDCLRYIFTTHQTEINIYLTGNLDKIGAGLGFLYSATGARRYIGSTMISLRQKCLPDNSKIEYNLKTMEDKITSIEQSIKTKNNK